MPSDIKLVDAFSLDADLTTIANTIRFKSGTSSPLAFPSGFVNAINAIPVGYTPSDFINRTISGNITLTPLTTITGTVSGVFRGFTGLVSVLVLASAAFSISENTFRECTGLTKFKCEPYDGYSGGVYVGPTAFMGNSNLQYAIGLNDCKNQAFQNDTKLEAVDMVYKDVNSGLSGNLVFSGCSRLSVLVIRGEGVAKLNNTNCFGSTPFASGNAGGTLYVPSNQITAYQAATNWSTILGYTNNNIAAIEGSPYETAFVDGSTIPT